MHYATQEWSDFVRGVSPEPTVARMQRHLSSGCPSCNRAANLLRKVVLTAAEPEVEVPAFVIRKAKAIFDIPRRRLIARIVFDSFLEPLPAGVRSRNQMFRQAMFEAGNVLVDVRLQNQQDGKILVTGQIADKASPNAPASRVTVHLVSGADRQPLKANRFGEFQTV